MKLKNLILFGFSLVVTITFSGCGGGGSSSNKNTLVQTGTFSDGNLENIVQYYQEKHNVPALSALTINIDGETEFSEIGEKQYSSGNIVSSNNHWGFGSITKSMTATLTAAMIEDNILQWSTTLSEVFPEFPNMQDRYKNITVVELLSHSAGMPQDNDEVWEDYVEDLRVAIEQRYEFTQDALEYESDEPQGEFLYSNANYVITASILEKLSGKSFELLMEEYLFTPLGMNNTYVDVSNQYDDIWGHKEENGIWKSIDPTINSVDNALILAPAGSRTFLSLEDVSKYLLLHLKAKSGEYEYLSKESFEKLHTQVLLADEDLAYSLGWYVEGDYGLQHSGSNSRWFSLAFINKDTKTAHFVSTNSATIDSQNAVFEMMQQLTARVK